MISLKGKDEKIVGYAILIAGLCIMGYGIASVVNLSQGGEVPIEILHAVEGESNQNIPSVGNDSNNMSAPNIDLGQMFVPLFPMFNLMAWLLIAFVILVAGGRVAQIGIKMMKASLPDVRIIRTETIKKIEQTKESLPLGKEEKKRQSEAK